MIRLCTGLLLTLLSLTLSSTAWSTPPEKASAPAEEADLEDPFEDEEDPFEDEEEGEEEGGMGSLLDEIAEEFSEVEPESAWDSPAEEQRSFPYTEHHGLFRVRTDFMYRLHLGTAIFGEVDKQFVTIGTSGIRPPLSENLVNNDNPDFGLSTVGSQDEDSLSGANLRFRYSPTIHVSRELRVGLQLDILDNLVMGSTPDYGMNRPDTPLAALSETQNSPIHGDNSVQNSVRIKQAYGEWLSPLGTLRAGRQAAHWGMGMVANDGQAPGSDFGDYWDRIQLRTSLPGTDLEMTLSKDSLYTGDVQVPESEYYGQSYDAYPQDDVNQFAFSISSFGSSSEELAVRHHRIHVDREPVFDWGIYYQHRSQLKDTVYGEGGAETVDVDISLHTPDFWARLDWSPEPGKHLHIEFEAAIVFGEIGFIPQTQTSAEVFQSGAALTIDWTTMENQLTLGFDSGFASGDKAEYFGVRDHHNLGTAADPNKKLMNFKFDRNFYVDQILFREVIGTVTNATYMKPWIQWDFFEQPELDAGIRMDLEWGIALQPEATPGDSFNLGVELDFSFFYEELGVFRADMTYAFFIPGQAFDLVPGYRDPDHDQSKISEWAARIQSRLIWMF